MKLDFYDDDDDDDDDNDNDNNNNNNNKVRCSFRNIGCL